MSAADKIVELTQSAHNKRHVQETSLAGLHERVKQLNSTNKFKNIGGIWHPQDYKGYAIVSMLDTNPNNDSLSNALVGIQQRTQEEMQLPHHLYMMPQGSFHQTVVNTLSGKRFHEHIVERGLECTYPDIIREAIEQTTSKPLQSPIQMKFAGVAIFGSAFGILGLIEEKEDWDAIMQFREEMYSNVTLNKHDIRRTRPFIAHITLGYIYGKLNTNQKNTLVHTFNVINQDLSESNLMFHLGKTELRSYNHLAEFVHKPNYPSYNFC